LQVSTRCFHTQLKAGPERRPEKTGVEARKVYQILLDEAAAKEGYLRVVDESGEDYLYPDSYFILVKLPRKAEDALVMASS
jgi:hypothetical protein